MAYAVKDRVKVTTTTTGTGAITLGSPVAGARAFAAAGIANGDTFPYAINGPAGWEIGEGTYVAAGTQMQRTTVHSNSAGNTSPISLTGTSEVMITPTEAAFARKADLASPALTGTPTAPTASPGTNTTQIATTAFVDAAIVAARPTSSIFPVGTLAFISWDGTGGPTLADGATVPGSSLYSYIFGDDYYVGAFQTGTWRNVSGGPLSADFGGHFVRIS